MYTIIIKRDHKQLERRRLAAGRMFARGKTQYAVAKHYGVSTAATNKWHTAWKAEGVRGLASKGKPGFRSQYTAEKKKELKQLILARPSAMGYSTDFWTIARIESAARKKLGITLGAKRTWATIMGLGFSVQRPIRRAKERNEKAIRDWRLNEFPKLKKMGA
jgi:transposase